ncbi:MAG: winged helix-turn-helix domain-containing protein [Anaerolineae bacterium]
MNFAEAAIAVLAEAGTPLHFRDITQRVIEQQLVEIQGQTPWNSMNGALRRVIRAQGKSSPVISLGDGRFALRAWNLPGEEIMLADEEDEETQEPKVAGSITISPRVQEGVKSGLRSLVSQGLASARQIAGLMVPIAPEYKPLHTTLSTILASGLFSILWGLGLSSGRKPGSVGLANTMLTLGCAESAAATVGLQQLSEAENDVMAGKMSMRQVHTQITAYERILGYGTAVGTTAIILGLALRLGAPANTRTRGAGSGLITHGALLALMTWRASKRARSNPTLT